MSNRTDAPVGVRHVPYPGSGAVLEDLRRRRVPRLLLVAAESPPPDGADELEDWVRMPADPVEVECRVELLARRAETVRERSGVRLDEDGIARRGEVVVAMPPVEHALLAVLLADAGMVVSHGRLLRVAASAGSTMRLSARLSRLRRRIAPLDVALHAASGTGYLLEVGPSSR